jgi:hypothetical protein
VRGKFPMIGPWASDTIMVRLGPRCASRRLRRELCGRTRFLSRALRGRTNHVALKIECEDGDRIPVACMPTPCDSGVRAMTSEANSRAPFLVREVLRGRWRSDRLLVGKPT